MDTKSESQAPQPSTAKNPFKYKIFKKNEFEKALKN